MQANPATFPATNLRVLRVDASARVDGSVSRQLADRMLGDLDERMPGLTVARRDLAPGLPLVDPAWVNAHVTDPDLRTAAQRQALAKSDELVAELMAADVLLIATPVVASMRGIIRVGIAWYTTEKIPDIIAWDAITVAAMERIRKGR